MDEKKTGYKLGLIAYGSLISEPGEELEPYITNKISCLTPFNIEYARTSATRSNAPTLIPHEAGSQVKAVILVLAESLSIDEAKSMLWRRETRNKKGSYTHKDNPSVNTVVVETIESWNGFDLLLYTSIGSNIDEKITAKKLSEYAIASILSPAGREKKDGVRYLLNAINAGIITPLTDTYKTEVLDTVQAVTLDQAISLLDNKRILQCFDKYLSQPDHLAIADALNAATTFSDKIGIYASEYGLLSSGGRIYTKDAQGNESGRIICTCSTCKKDSDFSTHYPEYEKRLKEEFDELTSMVQSSLAYQTKLKLWDAIFGGHPSLKYEFAGEEYNLQLVPQDQEDIEQENRFNYGKILKRYYLEPSSIPKYLNKDTASREEDYRAKFTNALYPNEFKTKVVGSIRSNADTLRDKQAALFFEQLVDGHTIDIRTKVLDHQDIFSLVAATEEYNFLKFVEQYPTQIPEAPGKMVKIAKSVLPIHFEDRSGREFERLAFAFLNSQKQWKTLEWLGESGDDGGRDIWGIMDKETYCYQCANYRSLPLAKVTADIDKLQRETHIPQNFTVICGGKIGNKTRKAIKEYAQLAGIVYTEIWSGAEFEEKLRTLAPELIERFVHGVAFPKNHTADRDILIAFSRCFDRPAFTTTFRNEVNIPDFEKAITDTIEVLNTGTHRLRDGTVIEAFPSRHQIRDTGIKQQMAAIYDKVVQLRNTFTALKKEQEIKPCGCDQEDCPVYVLTDKACEAMDGLRNRILADFSKLLPGFQIRIHH